MINSVERTTEVTYDMLGNFEQTHLHLHVVVLLQKQSFPRCIYQYQDLTHETTI